MTKFRLQIVREERLAKLHYLVNLTIKKGIFQGGTVNFLISSLTLRLLTLSFSEVFTFSKPYFDAVSL